LGTTASKRIEAAYAENEKRLASSKGRRYQHSSQDHGMNLIHSPKRVTCTLVFHNRSTFTCQAYAICNSSSQSPHEPWAYANHVILNQGVGRSYPPSLSRSYKWPTCDRKTRKSGFSKLPSPLIFALKNPQVLLSQTSSTQSPLPHISLMREAGDTSV
jgi:hypothetical protein